VQVDPKLTPCSPRLKLHCDEPLSISAFNCNLRRYTEVPDRLKAQTGREVQVEPMKPMSKASLTKRFESKI